MIINHNMNALNAHRNMTGNTASAGKSMEKLSSGLRINRAGDDAAGLAISEKMRGQIRGLDQASRNAQDGISLIQTAEGALNETHNILQRMRELSVQSANDTNITEDRTAIQEEMDALTTEINRISEQTQFNKQNLLDGSFNGTFQIGANGGQTIDLSIDGMNAQGLGLTSTITVTETVDLAGTGTGLGAGEYTVKGTDILDKEGNKAGSLDATGKVVTATGGKTYTFGTKIEEGGKFTVNAAGDKASQEVKKDTANSLKELAPGSYEVSGDIILRDGKKVGEVTFDAVTTTKVTGVKIGDKEINIADLKTAGIISNDADAKIVDSSFKVNGSDVSNSEKASGTIEVINSAIETVSTQRAKLGAVQNRLEHTTANLNTSSENLTAAESRVRDVDMAKEMMNFSKNNILSQAAQAMLAQANQQPQGVLQLLR